MKELDINAEINKRQDKIRSLKKQLENKRNNKDLFEIFAELETTRDNIIYQYNVINTLKQHADEKMKEMESRIFSSIQSFDKAFNKIEEILKSANIEKTVNEFKNSRDMK